MVRPLEPGADLAARVAAAVGSPIAGWVPAGRGGFSSAGLWVIETAGGRLAFVKTSGNDVTAQFLRDEMVVYDGVDASFMPEVIAWDDDGVQPFLVIEDLSGRHWPPPWRDEDVRSALEVAAEIAATPPPPGLRRDPGRPLEEGWRLIADQPGRMKGILSAGWLEEALPVLIEADGRAEFGGQALIHLDLRSDNMCFGGDTKVIDWNWARHGNPVVDVVGLLPSMHLEGGPEPSTILRGQPELVSAVAGFFLYHSTSPMPEDVRGDLREFQRAQGLIALRWACIDLGLSPPV